MKIYSTPIMLMGQGAIKLKHHRFLAWFRGYDFKLDGIRMTMKGSLHD
jgi:hypothetical protein